MKLSARNQLKGTVVEIREGTVNAQIILDVNGTHISSMISMEAVKDLGLTKGSEATAVIKSSNVILMTE